MLSTRDFPDQTSLDQARAERAARADAEAVRRNEQHDREAANKVAAAEAEANLSTTSQIDWMSILDLEQLPDMRAASAGLEEANHRLCAMEASRLDAEAELEALENRAAEGHRDDAGLRKARERVAGLDSDLRIADAAVRLAKQNKASVLRSCTFAAAANLAAQHREAVRELDKALRVASEHSLRAAAIEDKSRQLIMAGPYTPANRRWARRLRLAAWRKEFGPSGGFYTYWRKYHLDLIED